MKVKDKLQLDFHGLMEHGPINIVLLGDSVSHGAVIDNIDYENVYWNLLKKKLNQFRDYIPVNMINASIGGTTAKDALPRLDKHVLKHEPDLIIVCFGLNDVNGSLEDYIHSLHEIFTKCIASQSDVVFLTPNMLNTYVADDTPAQHVGYAYKTAQMQNEGRMDEFIYAAIDLARSMNVPVCDCYSKWKELSKTQDVTMLLANRINHPTAQMHQLFADCLYSFIIGDGQA
jgi:lysophospholipase L1-like esterase